MTPGSPSAPRRNRRQTVDPAPFPRSGERSYMRILMCLVSCLLLSSGVASAADLDDAEALYAAGDYEGCQTMAAKAVDKGIWNVRWPMLLIRCQLTTGQYADALTTYEAAAKRFTFNALPLQLQGIEVLRMNNETERAEQELVRIREQVRRSLGRFMSKQSMVATGRYLVTQGEDARKILEIFFDAAIEADPKFVDAYVASAELALQKNDFQLAAQTIDTAIQLQPDDPYLYYLKAQAWAPTDSQQAETALKAALQRNPRHVPSLLLQAERMIDGERYEQARQILRDVFRVNPYQPKAWAFLAVIANLEGKPEVEKLLRATALCTWESNPDVDHWIGTKLSQKYRFVEGAEYQRRALALRPASSQYRFQLAQDLLHLGDDEAGWELAHQTQQDDPYNIVAYNLMTLHDSLDSFQILQADGILLRMDPFEAEVYGQQAMELLQTAKRTLCEKYDIQPEKQIIVEIFPRQRDFAIRTFGLPGGEGYLGVCFGRLITANSPASQGPAPANWRSVLWHEFCHVVTLEKTRNRMPRWLSEGISVYEERQRDPRWGQHMTPAFREMILGEDLTPVSRLSEAFLKPKSAMHVQFAYYESSLVVEYFVDRYGIDALNHLLTDLGVGMPINEALQRHAGSLAALDSEFADYAVELAKQYGPDADWQRPESERPLSLAQWQELLADSPNNYWALKTAAEAAVQAERWKPAAELLDRLDALLPLDASAGCATELRARMAAQRDDLDAERQHLSELTERRDDDLPSYRRLAEIAAQQDEWEVVRDMAQQILAVNPLLPVGHQRLAEAGEAQDRPEDTAQALAVLSLMEPVDPADLHYRWAAALQKLNQPEAAKRQVLLALEHAPRYRQAYQLLISLHNEEQP
ncbi:tetratricopeptide repeat protein [Roseimaritima ulvae]|nr:tetratricopeptide repeat protein [Roseimaritima ulvae]